MFLSILIWFLYPKTSDATVESKIGQNAKSNIQAFNICI